MARSISQCDYLSRLIKILFCGLSMIVSVYSFADNGSSAFKPFAFEVPLNGSGAGSLTVMAQVGEQESEFLVDTGASMVTIEKALFDKLRKEGEVVKVRSVAARMANGRVQALDVYLIDKFVIGTQCNLGPIEVAVVPRGGRNLLGMNALNHAAPFGFSIEPPTLGLSRCDSETLLSSTSH